VEDFRKLSGLRRKRLCAFTMVACALSPGYASSALLTVGNCLDDNSSGSLRSVIARANDQDNIDVGMLTCSTITLTQGQLEVPQAHLGIEHKYHAGFERTTTINVNFASPFVPPGRIFHHTGGGLLSLINVTVSGGAISYVSTPASGGCIYSNGSVDLTGATVTNCVAGGFPAQGGAIFAQNAVTLAQSTVSASVILSGANSEAAGGGIFSRNGPVTLKASSVTGSGAQGGLTVFGGGIASFGGTITGTDCTISNNLLISNDDVARGAGLVASAGVNLTRCTVAYNTAMGAASSPSGRGGGGAIYTGGNSTIVDSIIDHNSAAYGGGLYVVNHGTASITNSTIATNSASNSGGALRTSGALTLRNATMAFNVAPIGAGAFVDTSTAGVGLTLQSTILADNVASDNPVSADLLIGGSNFTIDADNNLIVSANVSVPNALVRSCPRLQPLATNGGPTRTFALMHNSPAIDVGNNAAGLANDQRGNNFPRLYGGATDIGAYEWQGIADDRLFHSGFEAGCDE
jgi:hypothetical protein